MDMHLITELKIHVVNDKTEERNRHIHNHRDFNTLLSIIGRTSRLKKISQNIKYLNNTSNQLGKINIYKHYKSTIAEYTFFEVLMEHSPG